MPADFKSHVHASLTLPPGFLGPQQTNPIVLPVAVDQIRQALQEIRSRLIDTDDGVVANDAELSALAAAGMIVAPGGDTTAGSGSGQGRTLADGLGTVVSDGGAGGAITTNLSFDAQLTPEATVDPAADLVAMYDDSASTHRSVLVSNLLASGTPGAHDHVVSDITPVAANRLIGRVTGSGDAEEVALASGDLSFSWSGGTLTISLDLNVVANSELATMVQATVKGRASGAGTGNATDLTADQVIAILNTAAATLDAYVRGPASATDNALVRYDATTGKLVQNSSWTLDDNGNLKVATGDLIGIGNATVLQFSGLTTDEGYLNIASDATGVGPLINVGDNGGANADLRMKAKGTGVVKADQADGTQREVATISGTQTLTNKSIVASQLTGIIADARMPDLTGDVTTSEGAVATTAQAALITGKTEDATPDGAADYVLTYDASATALKKVLLDNLPGGSGGDVTTAGSVADNELTRYDGTTGDSIQGGNLIISDSAANAIDISTKASTDIYLYFKRASHGTMFAMYGTDNAVNYLFTVNGVAGGNPGIAAVGTDTDVNLVLETQGAGFVRPTRLFLLTNEKLQLRDTAIYLHSPADSEFDIVADGLIRLTAGSGLTLNLGDSTLGVIQAQTDLKVDIGAAANRPRNLILGGDANIGGTSASARLHVQEQTLGDEVFRIESVATNDDVAERVYQNRAATTDATVTTIHTITVPATTTVAFEAWIINRRTGGASGTAEDGASYLLRGVYKNVAGTATQIGTDGLTVDGESQAGWTVASAASGGTILIRVTGSASNNITWHATIRVKQVSS